MAKLPSLLAAFRPRPSSSDHSTWSRAVADKRSPRFNERREMSRLTAWGASMAKVGRSWNCDATEAVEQPRTGITGTYVWVVFGVGPCRCWLRFGLPLRRSRSSICLAGVGSPTGVRIFRTLEGRCPPRAPRRLSRPATYRSSSAVRMVVI